MHVFGTAAGLVVTLLAKVAVASTLTPPVLPLIVRNPYFSTWLSDARGDPWNTWPTFYTGEEIGFSVLASIPESKTVYPLLGRPHDSLAQGQNTSGYKLSLPLYTGAQYDASSTNLTYRIPNLSAKSESFIDVTLSFLSPITPSSTLRQSLPAAYIIVYVEGESPIDVYIDVNGQWVSGKKDSKIKWTHLEIPIDKEKYSQTWRVGKADEELFAEHRDRGEWGTLYFSGPQDAYAQAGSAEKLRQGFATYGILKGGLDTNFRSIMDDEPVFAFSKSFELGGNASAGHRTHGQALFTLAHVQDPVVQYASSRGLTLMKPLWKSWFSTEHDLLVYHYVDFFNVKDLAQNYSEQLAIDAYKSGSESYVDVVALSARQIMGATSFSGTLDNPILFLKEISSNGNCQTVDVIFPAFPFFLYTNPRWLAYLLEPLLEHQLSGQYPNKYSMHDLGTHFPNETGHADGRDEYMPVEECGDMLIMGLALLNSLSYGDGHNPQSPWSALGSGAHVDDDAESAFPLLNLVVWDKMDSIDDTWGGGIKGIKQAQKWLRRSYPLWKQWTGYLVEFSLEPHNQLSTDDFAGWLALQTNLALKGIVGIKAMSEMADVLGKTEDAKYYRNISDTYISKWQELGISRDGTHAKLAYDWYGSWTTLYSLFADAILCFHPSLTNPPDDDVDHYHRQHRKQCQQQLQKQESDRDESLHVAELPHSQTPLGSFLSNNADPNYSPDHNKNKKEKKKNTNDFIPPQIYHRQSAWYATVLQKYGLPLDSRHRYAKSDWEFEAAAVASPAVRADILDRFARWVNETSTDRPLTDLYETEGSGGFPGPRFFARPVVGGHFAFLALERACGGRASLNYYDDDYNDDDGGDGGGAEGVDVSRGSGNGGVEENEDEDANRVYGWDEL